MEQNGISIVLPCYNQAVVLTTTLTAIRNFFDEADIPYEIIVVNDGSADETGAILQTAQLGGVRVYTHTKNLGKGRAVQTGVLAAEYPLTLFLDADLAIPIEEAQKFRQRLEENLTLDIVIASRFVPGHTTLVPVLWHRKVLEQVFRWLRKMIIGIPHIQDTQCGFKMFRTTIGKELFSTLTCNRFSFDAELLFIAHAWGMRMQELPVALQNPQASSIRLGRDSVQMLLDLFKIRWKHFFGWYQKREVHAQNVTLDDFGINGRVNERILNLVDHARVARVAVMADGNVSPAMTEALLESGKKIDIHLELPVTTLVGERKVHGNFFSRLVAFGALVWRGELQTKRVEESWRAQIKAFQQVFGRNPDGINAHEHTHFYPGFFMIVLRLAKEYQIPFVRFGKRTSLCVHPVAWVLNILRVANILFIGKPRATSESLFSFDWGVHPKHLANDQAEILYHVERDEEWVHF